VPQSFTPKYDDVVTMFRDSVARHGDRPLYGVRKPGGWVWTSYRQAGVLVDAMRAALVELGVERGDRVACVSGNRLEWVIAAYAAQSLGATWVPMYENQHEHEQAYILSDCGAKLCFAGSAKAESGVRALVERGEVPQLAQVVGFSDDGPGGFWARLEKGKARAVAPIVPTGSDLCSIVYTSGTTGNPKGVCLTHRNLAAAVQAAEMVIPFGADDRTVAFLPWAHVFGGNVELNTLMSIGGSMAICEQADQLIEMLPEVKPTLLVAVPRVWNRIHTAVQRSLAEQPRFLRWVVERALVAGAARRRGKSPTLLDGLALAFARRTVFARIVARFGGQLKYAVSGAAALSPEVGEFVDTLGVTVFEGYGMTESSGVATVNTPAAQRIGSVGKPIPGVRVELDTTAAGSEGGTGEIILHGHCVMQGYYNRPDDTRAALTADGGLRTGDLGRVDGDGFLFITGRVKELYKLENGKYVAPAPLEEQLTLSPFIAQALVHGANKPHNVALLVPELGALRKWAGEHGVGGDGTDRLLADARVRALFASELEKQQAAWKGYERVRGFDLLAEEFSTANDMLTPTLKVKRRNVLKRYEARLEALYKS
jgi:long-chain acyl-CoA synthetase